MNKENKFYTVEEIAVLLGVSSSSVLRWVESGKLKSVLNLNGNTTFRSIDLVEFAVEYNISTQFLERTEKKLKTISAAK